MFKITVGTAKVGPRSMELVSDILRSGRISAGKYVAEFEKRFAKYHKVSTAVAVGTGTDAVTIALSALHEIPGAGVDEIIMPALTFVATANAVVHAHFKPVFVDVDPDTYCLDPDLVAEAITDKTRAILPVHLFGRPAEMDQLLGLAKEKGLAVVEDAAEAHGALYKGKKVGTFGQAGAFSFYVAHIITTGEGGGIITDHSEWGELFRSLRAHGRYCKCPECRLNISSEFCPLRFQTEDHRDGRFFFERIGYSAKMTEIGAALGLEQIEKLDQIIEKRRSNLFTLNEALKEYRHFLKFFHERAHEKLSPLAYPVVIKKEAPFNRSVMVEYLEKSGIETRPMFGSIPTQHTAYKHLHHKIGDFPHSEFIGERGFYIGIHQNLSQSDLDFMADTFVKFLKQY